MQKTDFEDKMNNGPSEEACEFLIEPINKKFTLYHESWG